MVLNGSQKENETSKAGFEVLAILSPVPSGFMCWSHQIPEALQMRFALPSPHHFLLCHLLYLPRLLSIHQGDPGISALGKLALTTSQPRSKRVSKLLVTLRLRSAALSTYLPGSPTQPLHSSHSDEGVAFFLLQCRDGSIT